MTVRLNEREYNILKGIVSLGGDTYALPLQGEIEHEMSLGALYHHLSVLERAKLVRSRPGKLMPTQNNQPKLSFRITKGGRRALAEKDDALMSIAALHYQFVTTRV